MREEFVVNGLGGFYRTDFHFFDQKSNVAIVARIPGQRRLDSDISDRGRPIGPELEAQRGLGP